MISPINITIAEQHLAQSIPQVGSELKQMFDDIICHRRLTPHFQPIVDLQTGKIIGYESLIRGPSDSPLHPPGVLFETAIRLNRLVELEILCRDTNIEFFSRLQLPGKLFLNISPKALMEPDFPRGFTKQSIHKHGLDSNRLVIELTEDFPIFDIEVVRQNLEYYRNTGFQVALDDLGTAYAGLRLWSELKPDYVKFDKYFIQSINRDPHKKYLIQSLQDIAAQVGCQTIAEGVETIEEYYTVQAIGVTYGQGYYFGRPASAPAISLPAEILLQQPNKLTTNYEWGTVTVSCLLKIVPTIQSGITLNEVGDLMEKYPELMSLPVVDGDVAIGILQRRQVWDLLASRYGRDLFGKSPISSLDIISTKVLRTEIHTPVEQLSQTITNEGAETQDNIFIILEKGRYRGVGLLVDLLKQITEMQIRNAHYANPLTMLPGNVPIEKKLEYYLAESRAFTVCYFDLDNFKPFNDVYGYSRGDMAIRLTATILKDGCHPQKDFIGHIGGDDFIIIFCSENWQDRCERILARFAGEILDLYDAEHRLEGGIEALDRQGNMVRYNFISLSIGATHYPGTNSISSHHEISCQAAEAKKQAKKTPGNSLFINRRSQPCSDDND
ncbi:MAG: GGDEF domain-containing protein [Pelovirga sp.]